jgi:hypothetical protein
VKRGRVGVKLYKGVVIGLLWLARDVGVRSSWSMAHLWEDGSGGIPVEVNRRVLLVVARIFRERSQGRTDQRPPDWVG